jgi:hypothetical protein
MAARRRGKATVPRDGGLLLWHIWSEEDEGRDIREIAIEDADRVFRQFERELAEQQRPPRRTKNKLKNA